MHISKANQKTIFIKNIQILFAWKNLAFAEVRRYTNIYTEWNGDKRKSNNIGSEGERMFTEGPNGSVESYIIHLLEVRTRVSVDDLCHTFGLAPSTIRKKLARLESQELLVRTHGGAVSIDANRDEPIDKKSLVNIPQKKAIAAAAVEFINDGDVISLGGGSTVAELSIYIRKLKSLVVLTNSIMIADMIARNQNVEVRINSGIVRGRTGCVVGPGADALFHNQPADKAFIGCDSFSLTNGVGSANILVGEVERNMLRYAKEQYVLCDSSKLNKSSVYSLIHANDITALITDDDADPYYVDELRKSGLEVVVASGFHPRRTIRDRF